MFLMTLEKSTVRKSFFSYKSHKTVYYLLLIYLNSTKKCDFSGKLQIAGCRHLKKKRVLSIFA